MAQEHIVGSPTTIRLGSNQPQLSRTEIFGDGLQSGMAGKPSSFHLKFFDMYNNRTVPGPDLQLGLALLQGKTYKDVSESHEYVMAPVNGASDTNEYVVTFTPSVEGTFSLHVWAEMEASHGGARERSPLPGSPFQCVVVSGAAHPEASYVDGWSRESRAVDKQGKAVAEASDQIIAGDAVTCKPVICDALGNKTVPEENMLDISATLPDGTTLGVESQSPVRALEYEPSNP